MSAVDIESRLSLLARRFEEARNGRTGREIRRYPVALWGVVASLRKTGVSDSALCKRCCVAPATLAKALGRLSARESQEVSRIPRLPALKTLVVEATVSLPETCEIAFPNGVVIRVGTLALDGSLLERLRRC